MDEIEQKLKALTGEKERMIRHYMSLQDKADAVNGEIYRTCCGIEALNSQIAAVQAELKRAASRNGTPAPSGGK